MRNIYKFTEELFIEQFVQELKTKAICFSDISFTQKYIEEEIKPMINVVDFMFVNHFISEDCYYQCKNIYDETITRAKNSLEEKYKKEAAENNRTFEQRKLEEKEYIDNFINTHKAGDIVRIKGTLIGTRLPRYLECSPLTIIGFTKKGNVKCKYDENSTFNIPPHYLKDL